RRIAEEQAATSQARLTEIIESSHDAVITGTLDGTITGWNPAAERIYGYTAPEAIGQSVTLIVPPEVRTQVLRAVPAIARGERFENVERPGARKDGSIVDISASAVPLRDRNGTVIEVCGTHRDITARKRVEARERFLSERSAQVERLESLGTLAGGIA